MASILLLLKTLLGNIFSVWATVYFYLETSNWEKEKQLTNDLFSFKYNFNLENNFAFFLFVFPIFFKEKLPIIYLFCNNNSSNPCKAFKDRFFSRNLKNPYAAKSEKFRIPISSWTVTFDAQISRDIFCIEIWYWEC